MPETNPGFGFFAFRGSIMRKAFDLCVFTITAMAICILMPAAILLCVLAMGWRELEDRFL